MKQALKKNKKYSLRVKAISIMIIIFSAMVVMASSMKKSNPASTAVNENLEKHVIAPEIVINKDSVESVKAFMKVYQVLMSPRCMNCHPAGDIPLQGDESVLHTMSPRRGKDGKGMYAMKCTNCHQPENSLGIHTPPGNPDWHLPPADMKMIFQGRTAHQLAKQLMDPKQNGHKTKEQLIKHADDDLVLAGWNPGEGRKLPPMSHAEFKKAWITWITKGGYAPKAK